MERKVKCLKCGNAWLNTGKGKPRCTKRGCMSWDVEILETLVGDEPVTGRRGESEEGTIGLDIFKRYLKDAGITKRAEGISKAFSRHQADDLGALESILRKSDVTPASMALMLDLWGGYQGVHREQEVLESKETDATEKMLKDMEVEELREARAEYQALRLRRKIEDLKRGMSGESTVEKSTSPTITRKIPLQDTEGNLVYDRGGKVVFETVVMPAAQLQQSQGGGGDSTLTILKTLGQLGLIGGGGGGSSSQDNIKDTLSTLKELGLVRRPEDEIEKLEVRLDELKKDSAHKSDKATEITATRDIVVEAIQSGKEMVKASNEKLGGIVDKMTAHFTEQDKHNRYLERLRGGSAVGLSPEEEHTRFETERIPDVSDEDLIEEMGKGGGGAALSERKKAVVPGSG